MPKIRVLIVDDHPVLAEGLNALLMRQADIDVVGMAQDGRQAVDLVAELQPDVVIMDIAMPVMNGIEATRIICEGHVKSRVLILTQREDSQYVMPLLRMGASGIVLKRAVVNDLMAALRVVARGETFLYPSIASAVVDHINARVVENGAPPAPLTPRERQVLELVITGKSNAQIAELLAVSVKTVEFHRMNVMSKLGVHTAVDLVRAALKHRLVEF